MEDKELAPEGFDSGERVELRPVTAYSGMCDLRMPRFPGRI